MYLPALLYQFVLLQSSAIWAPNDARGSHQTALSVKEASAVPGDSPCIYVGDPSNDILTIEALDLELNPPADWLTVRLKGKLNYDLGSKPLVKMTAALNGTVGPSAEGDFCLSNIKFTQDGKSVCPPEKGPVEMTYSVIIVHPFYKKGNYTVHVQMWATDGSRVTDFEGTVWVNGGIDGDDGWLRVDRNAGEKP